MYKAHIVCSLGKAKKPNEATPSYIEKTLYRNFIIYKSLLRYILAYISSPEASSVGKHQLTADIWA